MSNSVFIDCFTLGPPVLTGGRAGSTLCMARIPEHTPQKGINPVTELTQQLGEVDERAVYVQI